VKSSEMPPPAWRAWTVWLVAAVFYLAAFYIRVSPAVMTTELMRDLRISAADLGYLSAFYYYAYVLMQFPTGVLVDTLGARRLLVAGALTAAAGTLLFALSDSFVVACAARAVMGAATAIGWVVTLKLATHWFRSGVFATISGLGLLIGNIGALFAQVPLRILVESFGWRRVTIGSAAFILLICALAWTLVRDDPSEVGFLTFAPSLRGEKRAQSNSLVSIVRAIFGYRNTWLIFIGQGGFVGAVLSFTGLWGPQFLRVRFDLKATTAAAICSVMIVCWAVASPVFGYMSDRIGRRKPLYVAGAFVACLGWMAMFYAPLPPQIFIGIAALTSFASGAVILGFAYAKESVPSYALGTISGTVNAGNMMGPMLLQPAIGRVLDSHWTGQLASGARVYSLQDFQAAFALVAGWSILTCILASFTKETYCRPNLTESTIPESDRLSSVSRSADLP
jgi:sugar phosphate permease